MNDCRGQATVEVVAGVAALALTALLAFQVLAAGYASTLADGAAEAGAIAVTRGDAVVPAVRSALPGWGRERVKVSRQGGLVTVRLQPPVLLRSLAGRLTVSSQARGRP